MVLHSLSVSLRRLVHSARLWLLAEGASSALAANGGSGGTATGNSNARTRRRAATSASERQQRHRNRARTLSMVKHSRSKAGYSWPYWVLGFFGLFALGTFIVLQTVKHFFGTNELDFISLEEVRALKFEHVLPFNASMSPADALAEEQRTGLRREKIPRIIHQTWKTESLPERWVAVRKDCMRMLPNYEFKMWTDVTSREFIQTEYPSFLATWDSYSQWTTAQIQETHLLIIL